MSWQNFYHFFFSNKLCPTFDEDFAVHLRGTGVERFLLVWHSNSVERGKSSFYSQQEFSFSLSRIRRRKTRWPSGSSKLCRFVKFFLASKKKNVLIDRTISGPFILSGFHRQLEEKTRTGKSRNKKQQETSEMKSLSRRTRKIFIRSTAANTFGKAASAFLIRRFIHRFTNEIEQKFWNFFWPVSPKLFTINLSVKKKKQNRLRRREFLFSSAFSWISSNLEQMG